MKIRITNIVLNLMLAGSPFLLSVGTASARDMLFKPYISVSEELNDNILEQPSNKRSDSITRISHGASLQYNSPFWTWNTAYNFDYRTYSRSTRDNEFNHTGSAAGNIRLIDKFLFLDLNDTYKRVTLDVSRNAATEPSLFLNQSDQNVAIISPYLLWRLRGDSTLKTGYRFTDTRYWNSIGIDKQEHKSYADLTHEINTRLSLTAGYSFTGLESQPANFNRHDLSGGFKYEYADKSFVYGQIGNSWQQFDSGLDVNYLFWNAGITHDSPFSVATLETKVSTTEDPLAVSTIETCYSAKLDKTMQRGMLGMSAVYSEYVNTQTDILDRKKLSITATGRYEVMQNLTANLTAIGERFSKQTAADYPYRYSGIGGLTYSFKDNLTLGLTYSFVSYLLDLDTTAGSYQINKAVIEVKKGF